MMNGSLEVLIIEDERLAADHLEKLLLESTFEVKIRDRVDSVKNAMIWFNQHSSPDLIFMDVDLGDGLCFEIFEGTEIKAPIVFTTAYDEYAIRAFKVNSIDYLLKPIDQDELSNAIIKYYNLAEVSPDYQSRVAKTVGAL